MRCSNCGTDIPFEGKVCPWCKVDKTGDQISFSLAMVGAISGGVAGLCIGAITQSYFIWLIVGIAGGTVAGTLYGLELAAKRKRDQVAIRRDEVLHRIQEQTPMTGHAVAGAINPPPVSYDEPPSVDIVAITRQQEAQMLASGDYQKCPHCAEIIKKEARICRFCRMQVAVPLAH